MKKQANIGISGLWNAGLNTIGAVVSTIETVAVGSNNTVTQVFKSADDLGQVALNNSGMMLANSNHELTKNQLELDADIEEFTKALADAGEAPAIVTEVPTT